MEILDDIKDYIGSGWEAFIGFFSGIRDIDFSPGEVIGSIRFWISFGVSYGLLFWMLQQWKDSMDQSVTQFYYIGAVAGLVISYFWTARSIEKDG